MVYVLVFKEFMYVWISIVIDDISIGIYDISIGIDDIGIIL